MGGKASRDKGMRAEYAVRDYFISKGYVAHRIPASGAAQGFKGDILVKKGDYSFIVEVKVRAGKFGPVYECLEFFGGTNVGGQINGLQWQLASEFTWLNIPSLDLVNSVISFSSYTPKKSERGKLSKFEKSLLSVSQFAKHSSFVVIKQDRKPFLFLKFDPQNNDLNS